MKKIWLMAFFIPAVLLLASAPRLKHTQTRAANAAPLTAAELSESAAPPSEEAASESFRIKRSSDGKIETLSAEAYICGVLCGEMSADFSDEALKAQAVAAYTFACRRKQANKEKAYDLTDDFTVDQCYISPEAAQEKWGKAAAGALERFKGLVNEVSGYMVTYNGTAALTVYHAISSGKTQSSADAWGGEVPYLCGVESLGDITASGYASTVKYTPEEVSKRLNGLVKTSGEASAWFSAPVKNSSSYIKQINVCGTEISGGELRKTLELRSSCFEVSYSEGVFIFNVKGSGHGVGMSQMGAEAMAQQGSSFDEILCHYYPGCSVQKIKIG